MRIFDHLPRPLFKANYGCKVAIRYRRARGRLLEIEAAFWNRRYQGRKACPRGNTCRMGSLSRPSPAMVRVRWATPSVGNAKAGLKTITGEALSDRGRWQVLEAAGFSADGREPVGQSGDRKKRRLHLFRPCHHVDIVIISAICRANGVPTRGGALAIGTFRRPSTCRRWQFHKGGNDVHRSEFSKHPPVPVALAHSKAGKRGRT
jgi:hypothetical protein